MIILFKSFLLLGVIFFMYLIVFRMRTVLIQRALSVPIGLLLCVFTVAPDLSTRIARFFGIGRGADLMFYLAHMAELFFLLVLYARYQRVTADLADMVRQQALDRARAPAKEP